MGDRDGMGGGASVDAAELEALADALEQIDRLERRARAAMVESAAEQEAFTMLLREIDFPTGHGVVDVELDDEALVSELRFRASAVDLEIDRLMLEISAAITLVAGRPRAPEAASGLDRVGDPTDPDPIPVSVESTDGLVAVTAVHGGVAAIRVDPRLLTVLSPALARVIADTAREAQLRSLGRNGAGRA